MIMLVHVHVHVLVLVLVLVVVVAVLVLVVRMLMRVRVPPWPIDLEAFPDERAALSLPESDAQSTHAHRLHGAGHHSGRNAEVDQRGDRHVARDPGAGLEVKVQAAQRLHRSRFRLSIAAIWPAPKPLSMFTTAIPAAHEFSIDSSAAKPPRLAP